MRRQAVVVVRHKKLGHPPLSTFGDGLLRVFTLATTIPTVKGGLLLIDELETAIHTTMLERTFDWLVKACMQNNVQLFATTHSLETIDAVLSACDEAADLVVYRLQKKDKATAITRFDKDYLTRLREELGVEIRW
jgi:AAA15 family ATPase/GTPase